MTRWFQKLRPLAPNLLLNGRSKTFHFALYPCQERLCEFLQHVGRILNAYFPKDELAEIFLTAVQCGMPHREGVRRLLYDLDFNHGSLRFRSWDNSIFSQGTFAGYDIRESAFCFAISGNRQIRCRSPPAALMAIKNL